jgi:hypothetical protein
MWTNSVRRTAILSALLLASGAILQAALLDGTRWKVRVVPDEAAAKKGAKAFDDVLVFADGKLTSTTLAQKGFKPGKYFAEAEPHEAEFEAELVAATNNVVTWSGEIRGTNVLGGVQWLQQDGTYQGYTFTGAKE